MKKGIKYGLAVLGVVIVGVGVGWASGSPKGIHVSDGAKYQYQLIDPEDIIIEYSGLKPDMKLSKYKDKYVSDTTAYLTDSVGVYLGDNHFEAKVPEFVKYSDINWKWNISNVELYNLMVSQGSVNTEFFEGTIDYADGMQGNVKADSVNLRAEEGKMVVEVEFRGKKFPYKVEIKDNWGDGESLSEEQLEQLKQEEQEQGSEVVDVNKTRFSLEDAPELTNVDWDLFNEAASYCRSNEPYISDLFLRVGSDVRVNWQEVNDAFEYYSKHGLPGYMDFVSKLFSAYDDTFDELAFREVDGYGIWINSLELEPYVSNTEMYQDVKEEFDRRYSEELIESGWSEKTGWYSEEDYEVSEYTRIFAMYMPDGEYVLTPLFKDKGLDAKVSWLVDYCAVSIVKDFFDYFDEEYGIDWLYYRVPILDRKIKEMLPECYDAYREKAEPAVDNVFIEKGYVDENGNATMHYSDFLR